MLRFADDAVGFQGMRDERFAQLSDAAVKLLADRAVQELQSALAKEERALREITALRDEMIDRLRRRGEDENGEDAPVPRTPTPRGGGTAASLPH